MRVKLIIFTAAASLLLAANSCNNEDTTPDYFSLWQEYLGSISTAFDGKTIDYKGFPFNNPAPLLFRHDVQWDEVIYDKYEISQNYVLNHYEMIKIEHLDECDKFALYCNSDLLGYVFLYYNGEVKFLNNNTSEISLLYDFKHICKNSAGVYRSKLGGPLGVTYYTDLNLTPEEAKLLDLTTDGPSFYPFIEDSYGGLSIALLGSTAGFLAPIDSIEYNKKREILQAYIITYRELQNSNPTPYIEIQLLYSNTECDIAKFLPEGFWVNSDEFRNNLYNH